MTLSKTLKVLFGASFALTGCLSVFSAVLQGDEPQNIFDWETFKEFNIPGVTPVPDPGFHVNLDTTKAVIDYQSSHNGITGIIIKHCTGPFDGKGYAGMQGKEMLGLVMDYVNSKPGCSLNFVFADLEQKTEIENTKEMVRQVRSHPNPLINKAFVGNYGYCPAKTADWDWLVARGSAAYKHRNNAYFATGVNMAMPCLYPTARFKKHYTLRGPGELFHGNACVSLPHAVFWAPLERLSTTARVLPPGHIMIPWITGYLDNEKSAQPAFVMARGDSRALLQHFRLRGIHGYYTYWDSDCKKNAATSDELRDDMYQNAWKPMDWFFKLPGKNQALNLNTSKTGGVEWSGIRRGNDYLFIFSNFTDKPAQVNLPAIKGLPAKSPVIPAASATGGKHLITHYVLDQK